MEPDGTLADVDTAHALGPGGATGPVGTEADPALAERLDRVMLRMRRMVARPPAAALPVASLGRCVDFAKVTACLAVAELSEDAGGASVKDVAEALHLEHSTASRLLRDTEEDGLVSRAADPVDRRRTAVSLTRDGRELVTDSTAVRVGAMARVFAGWEEPELRQLVELLERMVDTLVAEMPGVVAALAADDGESPC